MHSWKRFHVVPFFEAFVTFARRFDDNECVVSIPFSFFAEELRDIVRNFPQLLFDA